jgi:hypothetical protein
VLKGRMINEISIGKDMKGNGGGIVESIIQEFA